MVPSARGGSTLSAGCGRPGGVGRRNTTVPGVAPPSSSVSAGEIVAVPSVLAVRPGSPPSAAPPASAARGARGSRGSGPEAEPQDTRRSLSPPKPVWRERSAPHAEAGSGRMPCRGLSAVERPESPWGAGSSSKKCGPVSSTAPDGPEPGGGAIGLPSEGAGRLVPGTQAAPFQYRTYPGMDGSG
jgi:hypothetical protein